MAGLGGGIIIKPLLDFLGQYNLATIGVLSSASVLAMSIVSFIKAKSAHIKIDKTVSLTIAFGSILGGLIGKGEFNYFVSIVNNTDTIAVFQSSLLAIVLLSIYIFFKYKELMKTYHFNNKVVIFLVGIFLGILSSFLGIGGGPLNVAVLCLLFSMNARHAVNNSILIIFCSQISALALIAIDTGFSVYDLSMLVYMVIGSVLGGYIGSDIELRLTNLQIERIFNSTILIFIFVNIYNIVNVYF